MFTMNTIIIIITALFIAAMSMQMLYTARFFTHLASTHAEVWKQLGKPRWKIQLGDPSFAHAVSYIRKKEFLALNDATLLRFYKRIKLADYIAIAMAVLMSIITIVQVISK